ncbi:MAG: YopX family protein [archaeon]
MVDIREYRGKTQYDNKWVYGYLVKKLSGFYIVYEDIYKGKKKRIESLVKENTIGQFTGLKDMKKKKIYEGDSDGVRTIMYVNDYAGFVLWNCQKQKFEELNCDIAFEKSFHLNIYDDNIDTLIL